jgi:hypothetical protein
MIFTNINIAVPGLNHRIAYLYPLISNLCDRVAASVSYFSLTLSYLYNDNFCCRLTLATVIVRDYRLIPVAFVSMLDFAQISNSHLGKSR